MRLPASPPTEMTYPFSMSHSVERRAHRARGIWGYVALGVASGIAIVAGCSGTEGSLQDQEPTPSPSASTSTGQDATAPTSSTPPTSNPTSTSPPDQDAGPPPSKPIVGYTGSSAVRGVTSSNGVQDMGHQFDVTEEGISIADLGIWDEKADGLAAAHTVTLFSLDRTGAGAKATPVPGGSVVVPAGTAAPLEDGFRFAPLVQPVTLAPGHYAVVAFGLDKKDPYGDGGNIPLSSTGIVDAKFDPFANGANSNGAFPTGGDSNPHACASFRYRGPHTSFIKIMPLGASITEGWASSASVAGYRGYLHTLLDQAGVAHQFVGSSVSHPGPLPADQRHHEGHPGYVIQSGSSGADGILDHLDEWLGPTGVTPDFILVLVGSNDVAKNYDFAHVGDRMDALITKISNPTTGLAPKARLVISTIPRINDATQEKRAVSFNTTIVNVAKKHAADGENVATIDAHAVVGPGDKADNLHPNDAGYEKIAPLWRDAILAP